MATYSWLGGVGGSWFDPSQWSPTGTPSPGATLTINSGTVDLTAAAETVTLPVLGSEEVPVDGETVTLGSSAAAHPAAITLQDAEIGANFTLDSAAYALLDVVGPVGFAGSINADTPGGTFTIDAVQSDGSRAADFVLLYGGGINVTAGDNLSLAGTIDIQANAYIQAGSTLTLGANTLVRVFAGGTTLAAGSVLSGSGTIEAGPDSTLFLNAAVAANQTIEYSGAGRVDFGDVSGFGGVITNFTTGSTIDLRSTIANYASYSAATGLLTIKDGTTQIAALHLQGPVSSELFATASDGAGGTVIDVPGSATRVSYEIDTADRAVQANVVRATMTTAAGAPINGAGVTIGIMSDSFNATVNGVVDPADVAAAGGYLPATANGLSAVRILADSSAPGVVDEGLAMAELVHQIAPGASIDFYTAEGTDANFANGVNALVAAGANIIIDDWSSLTTPFFQVAGTIDAAVQNAIGHGVDYFTDTTNLGSSYFQANWSPVSAQLSLAAGPATVQAQRFSNGTDLQTITVPAGVATTLALQWNAAWSGSAADSLGMALYSNGALVASSVFQTGTPEDLLDVPVSSAAQAYQLAVYQVAGAPAPGLFKYVMEGSPGSAQEPGGTIDDPNAGTGSGPIHGWALVPGVNVVGADYWANSPAYGVPATSAEYFSSSGPGQLLFDQNGNPIDQSADLPTFLAPDGNDTSLSGFQPFYGSSAAVPDAAGVAALMLQANPNLTTTQVTSMLQQSAVSLGLPAADQGAGLIQAPAAVAAALACFAAGARIATERGYVKVQDLVVGDRAVVAGQARASAIRWIGYRHVDCRRHHRPDLVWPVRIRTDAFGPGRPNRDLYLSPDHAVFMRDVLIPVKHLIDNKSIVQVPVAQVTYYHIELPVHAVLIADGLTVESYLEAGGRGNFANGGAPIRLMPDFQPDIAALWEARACAPLVVHGAMLEAVRGMVGTYGARGTAA